MAAAADATLRGEVVDARTGEPLPARVYVSDTNGNFHFVRSAVPEGTAVRYDKRNWVNTNAVERHTTLSAHPFVVDLPPGRYTVTVERGKEYAPSSQTVEMTAAPEELTLPLRRWVDMAAEGWFSGETHLHRTPEELRNVMLAEDLNVAFPLTFWVTKAFTAPTAGDKNMAGDSAAGWVNVDSTHAFWPRNTEYEIFSVGTNRHTLGALFLLGHRTAFMDGVPPWGSVAAIATEEGAVLDMDKLDWPFSFMLPPVTGARLYELANNHHWRTEFGFTNYVSRAPRYMQPQPGRRTGNERQWTLYTLGMYYTLLNAGFPLVPTAGTASGVHPVPAGFSRVYVRMTNGFSPEAWLDGLKAGRSFVTTGPMLFVTVNGREAGATFQGADGAQTLRVAGRVLSEQPLAFIEIVQNGIAAKTIMPQNRLAGEVARETRFNEELTVHSSSWVAVRCWEDRPGGRFRFAHSGSWRVDFPGKPLRLRAEEKAFLRWRMSEELSRSRPLLPREAVAEYESALAVYDRMEVSDDGPEVAAQARKPENDDDLRYWLENMAWHHRFSIAEMRRVTGLESEALNEALVRFNIRLTNQPSRGPDAPLKVLPYPGGRHPRTGFLDGAIDPQRETKVSVFTPWDEASYVVVDVPEAIWSNLGLTYLAHTHVPTIWSKEGRELPRLEWNRRPDGTFESERTLPNGIAFGARVVPGRDAVRFELWLRNGTPARLTDLRVQNCVMLQGARGFSDQTGANKQTSGAYIAVRSDDGRRWIITAWDPLHRTWSNPPVPCLHSDPKFPDCAPGETVKVKGWLSFYQGTDIETEFKRIEATGWMRQ